MERWLHFHKGLSPDTHPTSLADPSPLASTLNGLMAHDYGVDGEGVLGYGAGIPAQTR